MYAIISCHDAKLAKTTNGIFGKIRLGYRLKICGSISSAYFRNFELGNPFCDAYVIKIHSVFGKFKYSTLLSKYYFSSKIFEIENYHSRFWKLQKSCSRLTSSANIITMITYNCQLTDLDRS